MTAAQELIKKWREYPVEFVRNNFKVEPDIWQAKALNAFASREPMACRIALKACAGPGKTACLSWIGWNFLSCYGERGEHPKSAAISVTHDNLKDNLWPEFSKWQQRSEFLHSTFVWTKERIFSRDHPETWFISARTFSKSADKETQGRTLSGLHSKYILYLIDESGDIPPSILRSAEQGLSNCLFGKIVQAGNPTSLDGVLYYGCVSQAQMWTIITITGDPDNPERSTRIDLKWAQDQIRQWGRDNPWVMSYILGLFPPASINQLLGAEEVDEAMNRKMRPDVYSWSQKRLGIDVARFGDDRTVIFPRQGLYSFRPVVMRHNAATDKPSVDIANRVMLAKQKWGNEREYFDDTVGWAHGAIDVMRAAGHASVAVNLASTKPTDPRYYNVRAQIWMELANWVRRGGKLPNIPEMKRELTSPTFTYLNGKFIIEEKKLIKARLGFSPDLGEGLALTFAEPDCPASDISLPFADNRGKLLHEYDPFADRGYHDDGDKVKHEYDPHSYERV